MSDDLRRAHARSAQSLPAIGRVVVGAVLLASGLRKAAAVPEEVAAVIDAYHILPIAAPVGIATAISLVEMSLGAMLITGYRVRRTATAASILLIAYIGALLLAIVRGLPLDHCGCFGAQIPLSPRMAVIVDLVLLMALSLARSPRRPQSLLDRWIDGATTRVSTAARASATARTVDGGGAGGSAL